MRKTAQKEYTVYRPKDDGYVWVDTVFFTGCTVEEVRKSLIDHDGYAPDIIVYEVKR